MAYLDSGNVEDLVADIKALADETYPPISDSIITRDPVGSGTDFNNVIISGRYLVPNRSNYTHAPATWGTLFVFIANSSTTNAVIQIWYTNNEIFFRYKANDTWYDWHEFAEVPSSTNSTIASPLPSGISSAKVTVVRSGHVVTVACHIGRNSTALSSYVTVATGLPTPYLVPYGSDTYTLPMFVEFQNTATEFKKPLYGYVRKADNELRINGGESGEYKFYFTYIAE